MIKKHLNTPITIILFLSACLYSDLSYGQYKWGGATGRMLRNKKYMERASFGFSWPMMKLNMLQSYKIDRSTTKPYAGPSVNKNILVNKINKMNIGLNGACGIMAVSSFKLAKISDRSIIALNLASGLDVYNWKVGTVTFSSVDSIKGDVFCMQGKFPFSIMIQSGGEALLNDDPLIFSAGAGVAPTYSISTTPDIASGFFQLRPFLTTEIGFHKGIGLKLRVDYYPGTLNLLQTTGSDLPGHETNGNYSIIASGSGNLVLSLHILLGTRFWENNRY